MQPDLESVLLSKGELRKLTGLDSLRYNFLIYYVILLSLLDLTEYERKGELNSAIKAFGDREMSWLIEFLINLIVKIIISIGLETKIKNKRKSPLINLFDDVKNHNKLIIQIDVMDQLQSIGNKIQIEDRNKVIEALIITRDNLVKSLKTEKILRENPGFRPESFSVDLISLRSLQINEQSSEYGQLLNEALQIGISIQDEIEDNLLKR